MKLKVLGRVWVALAIIPLMAGLAFASGSAMFVCRGDMIARAECCCQGEHGLSAPSGTTAKLTAASCCDVSQAKAPVRPGLGAPRALAPVASKVIFGPTIPLTLDFAPAGRHVWLASRFAHPPPLAVPILLAKRSFLI